jgi:hypothetical protein
MTPEDSTLASPTVDPADRPALGETLGRRPSSARRPLLVRLLPMLIVVVALGGFAGIVGYYYFAGASGSDGVVPLVKADDRPVKVRPENPGGMEVPDQDKEIYDRLGQAERNRAPTGERLLPPPETPLPRPPVAQAPPMLGVPAPSQSQTLSAAPPRPVGAPPPQAPNIPPAPDVTPPPPSTVTSQATIPPPSAAPANAPLPRPAAPAPAPPSPVPVAAAARPSAAAPGSVRVAIASVKSEADARREWERQRRLYPGALTQARAEFLPIDLGDRGVFWRIYVGPAESNADAQTRCAALKQQQVSCFIARP